MKKNKFTKYYSLAMSLLICFIPSFIGVYFRPGDWYMEIIKPSWTPPGWIFGPVWTMLYICMGIALWMVWESRDKTNIKLPLIVFSIQLILNAMWSCIFFGLQNLFVSVIEIYCLLAMIMLSIILFYRIRKIAGLILIPYLLWVSFASILNFTIWSLNKI